jgi:hypothetical protein
MPNLFMSSPQLRLFIILKGAYGRGQEVMSPPSRDGHKVDKLLKFTTS